MIIPEDGNLLSATFPHHNSHSKRSSQSTAFRRKASGGTGRYIVGNAGTTLYSVGSVKDIPEVRKFVFVDGGMSDNPRPALYHARYRAAVANRMSNSYGEKVTVAGKCCESGDILVKDIRLPEIKSGDLLAVLSTGAYNYSMASNYNRLPRPAVVLVKDGRADLVVKRESYKDVIRNDVIPDRLKK